MSNTTEIKYFKIKEGCGDHRANGKLYKAGEIVPSTKDLAKALPHKFIKVDAVPKDDEADKTLMDTLDGTVVMEYMPVDDEDFIDKVKEAEDKIKQKSVTTHISERDLGKNVTDQFPVAVTLELMIYQTKDDKYIPVDSDMPNRPLHDAMKKVELLNWLKNQD